VGGDHLQVAVTDRVIASSPCVGISLRERIDTEIVPFRRERGHRPGRRRARPVPSAHCFFGAGMGMRQGECFGLSVDRVDFLRSRSASTANPSGPEAVVLEFGPPKTSARFRPSPC
jgi:hypothetical protein